MKNLFSIVFFGIFLFGNISWAQTTGQYANPQNAAGTTSGTQSNTGAGNTTSQATGVEANNAVDVGILYDNIEDIEQNLDDIRFNNYEFSPYYSDKAAYNNTADGQNIQNLKDFTKPDGTIEQNIEIFKNRMGRSRNDLLPFFDKLKLLNKALYEKVLELETARGTKDVIIEDYIQSKDDLDTCFQTKSIDKCGNEQESVEVSRSYFQDIQEYYEQALKDTELQMKIFKDALIDFDQRLRAFRAPRVINAGILPGPKSEATQDNPQTGFRYISEQFIPAVVNWIMVALMGVSVIMIIGSGLMYIFTQEDGDKEKAKNMMMWTFIGMIVAILSYAIVQLIIGLDIEIL